jgi:lysozyme family protein
LLSQDVFFSTNLDKVSPIDTTISTNTWIPWWVITMIEKIH